MVNPSLPPLLFPYLSFQHLEAYSVDAVRCMVQRLLYFFSESIGRHACKTFCEKLEIGKNPISWLLALSSYLGSHGWSSLHFDSAIDPAIFKVNQPLPPVVHLTSL
jgi:hypothetical protein